MSAGAPRLWVEEGGGGVRLRGPAASPAVVASVLRPEGLEGGLGGAPGALDLDPGVPARVVVDCVIACLAAAQADRLWLHAATVVLPTGAVRPAPPGPPAPPERRALLITGPSGAGKTTLSLRLAARGAELLGEDLACLAPGAPTAHPVPRTPMLRPPAPAPFTDPDHRSPRALGALPAPAAPAPLGALVLLCPGGPRAPERFTPSVHDAELLHALTASNVVAATFGADDARWLFRWARVVAELTKVPCWRVWPGPLDATLAELERLALAAGHEARVRI